jgi:hypothetical protein
MRYLTVLFIAGIFLCQAVDALAGKGGKKGPSESAYEHANEHASFKRDEDWKPGDFGSDKKHDGGREHGKKKHKHKHKDREHKGDDDLDKKDDADQPENEPADVLQNEVKE